MKLCDEVIFDFRSSRLFIFWHYQGDTYWWTVFARARYYFNDAKSTGDHNCKYAASLDYNLSGNLYGLYLGMFIQKFRKYQKMYV